MAMIKSFRVFVDILVGYLLLVPSLIYFFSDQNLTFVPHAIILLTLCLINSLTFHYLTLFIHASAHFNFVRQNKKVNDILSNILIGYIFLLPMSVYRKKHFGHHSLIGELDDPENSYQYDINLKNLFCWTCLVFPMRKMLSLYKSKKSSGKFTLSAFADRAISMFVFTSFHITMIFNSLGELEKYLFLIFIPQIMLLPMWNWLRTAAEHQPSEATDGKFVLRRFKFDFFGFFLGAAGFRYHDVHHTNPTIHYLDLSKNKNVVSAAEQARSYTQTLLKLIKSKNINDTIGLAPKVSDK